MRRLNDTNAKLPTPQSQLLMICQKSGRKKSIFKNWEYNLVFLIYKEGEYANCDCIFLVSLKVYAKVIQTILRKQITNNLKSEVFRLQRSTNNNISIVRNPMERPRQKAVSDLH